MSKYYLLLTMFLTFQNIFGLYGCKNFADEQNINKFFRAIKNNDLDFIKNAITLGFDLNQVNEDGLTPFLFACFIGSIESIELFINKNKDILKQKYEKNGSSALHFVADGNNPFLFHSLVKKYYLNPYVRNSCQMTPLHYAILADYEILEYLIKNYKYNLKEKNNRGQTFLHLAVANGKTSSVKLLINSGLDINEQDSKGCTILHLAISNGFEEIVKLLIEDYKITLNKNDEGSEALSYAIEKEKMFLLLVNKYKCNPRVYFRGQSFLHLALKFKNVNLAKILIYEYNIDPKETNQYGENALHIIASIGNLDLVRLLIEKYKIDPSLVANYKHNVFYYALFSGNYDLVKYLFEKYELDPNLFYDLSKETIFIAALKCYNLNLKIISYLIKLKADLNQTCKDKSTLELLSSSVHANTNTKYKTISLLVNNGALINNLKDRDLKIARDSAIIFELLEHCQDIKNLEENKKKERFKVINNRVKNLLKQAMTIIYVQDLEGNNALHLAILAGNIELAQIILSIAPKLITEKNYNDQTPVEFAIADGHNDFVQSLIKLSRIEK